ncbi:MAG: hypothetical protein EA407_14645 [Rhodobacteraceae bacterium]|nr:MAG: hypothetical protein EA407_14645 [Paracoccaceae bacterium]
MKSLKNIPGWRSRQKLVVFNVDDYGNVRIASPAAHEALTKAGLAVDGRFDRLDTLETRADLEALLEVLDSVRDKAGQGAVFTPYSLSANPDFDALRGTPDQYRYEDLPQSFARLSSEDPDAYEGAWALWQEGIARGLLQPEFHGREHLNLRLLEHKLARRDADAIANIAVKSMAGLRDDPASPGVGFTHAFGLADKADLAQHREILSDGLALFERVFGRPATCFTPPAQRLHPDLYAFLEGQGIRAIDKPLHTVRQLDRGKTRREVNFLGRKRGQGHVTLVRNVVFEPNLRPGTDEVARTLSQIAAAFRWGKPAMISSHRVNFCGHIDPANRRDGLDALKRLLQGIVQRWPDVEFIGAGELARRIEAGR